MGSNKTYDLFRYIDAKFLQYLGPYLSSRPLATPAIWLARYFLSSNLKLSCIGIVSYNGLNK